jgi:hypothetical protein
MAYSVSDRYKEIIYSGGANHKAILKINGTEIPNRQIESIEISDPLIDVEQKIFYIGQFASKQLIIKFKNTDNIPIEGNVDLSIATLVNDSWEEVPIGKFLIETNTEDYYNNNKLTCLDYAVKMKTNCDFSSLIVAEDGTITPVSLESLLTWICNHYGVELGSYPETNKDYLISTYDSTLSGKYYISLIAELMASNAHFGRDGALHIIPVKQAPIERINATKSKSFTKTSSYTISKVIFDDGIRKKEVGTDDNNTLFIRSENMFVLDDYESLIENIYNDINGLTITSLKTENYGDVSLDCWDLITYELDDEEYTTIHNSKIVYQQTIMGTIDVSIPTETQTSTTNIYDADDKTKIRKIQAQVNQVDGRLKITAQEVDGQNEKLASFEVEVEKIESLTSKTDVIENNLDNIEGKFDEYVPNSEFVTVTTKVQELQQETYSKTQVQEIIEGTYEDENGNKIAVRSVSTENGVFDKEGMHYAKTDENGNIISPTMSMINEKGLSIEAGKGKVTEDGADFETSAEDLLYAGYVDADKIAENPILEDFEGQSVVYSENSVVNNFFSFGGVSRLQKYSEEVEGTMRNGAGFFYIGE